MNNKCKKIICAILVTVFSFLCFSGSAFSAEADEVLKYKIADDGFAIVSECDKTTVGSVTIPADTVIGGKTYKVKYIGNRCFDGCDYITDITIPEGVTSIGNHAFRDCFSLKDLYVPESLIVCQYDAFDGCFDLTVHCYTANYQFFGVIGMSANIVIDILDPDEEDDAEVNISTDAISDSFITRFIEALKQMINSIMEYFNADDDFEIELPFDLPFDISV